MCSLYRSDGVSNSWLRFPLPLFATCETTTFTYTRASTPVCVLCVLVHCKYFTLMWRELSGLSGLRDRYLLLVVVFLTSLVRVSWVSSDANRCWRQMARFTVWTCILPLVRPRFYIPGWNFFLTISLRWHDQRVKGVTSNSMCAFNSKEQNILMNF